jgi:hypothetical protein
MLGVTPLAPLLAQDEMTRHDFLRSEFARELERVGRADVLVGIPTFNNAHTVGHWEIVFEKKGKDTS